MGDLLSAAQNIPLPGVSRDLEQFPQNSYLTFWAGFFLFLLMGSLVIGQLWRLPLLGQGGGLLLNDVAAVGLLVTAFFYLVFLTINKHKIPPEVIFLFIAVTPFALWSFFTLVLGSISLPLSEKLIVGSYWVRLMTLLYLLPMLLLFVHIRTLYVFLEKLWWATVFLICSIGILQLVLVPSLAGLSRFGWDPHQGRLVSSWLDPNLCAGFFLVVLPTAFLKAVQKKTLISVSLLIFIVVSLLFTQSRSAFLALAAWLVLFLPFFLYSIIKNNNRATYLARLYSMLGILVLCGVLAGLSLGDRFVGLLQGDATTRLRSEALSLVWQRLALPNLFLGVGYNAYQFAAAKVGLISNFALHSRAGSDNSLLNIVVTTGVPGLFLFILLWLAVILLLISVWRRSGKWVALVPLACLMLVVLQSQVVNSLLYGHILIALIVVTVLSYREALTSS